jgi:hypothetical protein
MGFDPSQFTSGYVAPDAYGAGQFDSGFTAPAGYTAGSFDAGTFDTAAMNQYMSPFIQGALNPQLDEARRQAEISRVQNAGRMTQAGAFGGSRQAIMESEMDRNLQRNLSDITGTGMMSAYDKAMQAYQTDQQRRLQAEGMGEQSRQFGAGQAMSAADAAARYGLQGQQMGEQSRQFGAGQAMSAADTAARYGLQGQQMGEQSRQFGAGFGLDALSRELQARQAQSQMGRSVFDAERDLLGTQMGAGATQRGIEQEGIAAAMGQFEQERDYPYKQVQFMQSLLQGMPLEAQNYSYVEPDALSRFLGGGAGILSLLRDLNLGGSTGTPTQQYSAEQLAAMEAGG